MNDVVRTDDNEIKSQIMTFDIPLNDTSSAGLGITLKGKTSFVDGQSVDLGIFVKSILTGGAASRVSFIVIQCVLNFFFLSIIRIIKQSINNINKMNLNC